MQKAAYRTERPTEENRQGKRICYGKIFHGELWSGVWHCGRISERIEAVGTADGDGQRGYEAGNVSAERERPGETEKECAAC